MSASDAQKCFLENRDLFGNSKTQPEKYNLYNGLANLADAVIALERKIKNIEDDVHKIKRATL